MGKHLGELQDQIDKADETKAEKVSTEAACQDALKAATDKCAASEQGLKAAEEALESLKAEHLKFLADMNTAGEASGASEAVVAAKESRLQRVQSALSAFQELFERAKPVAEEKLEAV